MTLSFSHVKTAACLQHQRSLEVHTWANEWKESSDINTMITNCCYFNPYFTVGQYCRGLVFKQSFTSALLKWSHLRTRDHVFYHALFTGKHFMTVWPNFAQNILVLQGSTLSLKKSHKVKQIDFLLLASKSIFLARQILVLQVLEKSFFSAAVLLTDGRCLCACAGTTCYLVLMGQNLNKRMNTKKS